MALNETRPIKIAVLRLHKVSQTSIVIWYFLLSDNLKCYHFHGCVRHLCDI